MPYNPPYYFAALLFFNTCWLPSLKTVPEPTQVTSTPVSVKQIPVVQGFCRKSTSIISFAYWLQQVPLKKNNTVYLFNGNKKQNQSAQYAVLNISVGEKDLQQCADAVMRLRAEYLWETKQPDKIQFTATDGTILNWNEWKSGKHFKLSGNRLKAYQRNILDGTRKDFEAYLQFVFTYCGTASLQQQLKMVKDNAAIKPGDVFIQGGFPGHAVMVMDEVVNEQGEKRYLLAQSYMPAQDIHILKNPSAKDSPWYTLDIDKPLQTPEWSFPANSLYSW